MSRLLILLLLLACLPLATAQVNFVKNGDFSLLDTQGIPVNWKVTSLSFHNAKVADFAFNGTPIFKKSFACQPGGSSAHTRPYPLVVLEQEVVMPGGIDIEFYADVCHSRMASVNNADRGQYKIYLGTQLLNTTPSKMSGLAGPIAMMETINFRTKLATGGKMTLKITCERNYYATDVICNIDNIFCGPTPAPAFSFTGDRKLGKPFTYRLIGTPGASVLVMMSTGPGLIPGGISFPGISGPFNLDIRRFFQMWNGTLDTTGMLATSAGTFPNLPGLKGVPLWFQGFQATTAPLFSFGLARPFAFY